MALRLAPPSTWRSRSAAVSVAGRLFYIIDEGPVASVKEPSEWKLVARDAFNGTVLWRRPMGQWHSHMFGLKSGPASLPRRLVSQGDQVYVTLGLNSAVAQLDARTGETIQQYERTEGTTEILLDGNTLHLVAGPLPEKGAWFAEAQRKLMALAADTGKEVWRFAADGRVDSPPAIAGGLCVFGSADGSVYCLRASDGQLVWRFFAGRHGQWFLRLLFAVGR